MFAKSLELFSPHLVTLADSPGAHGFSGVTPLAHSLAAAALATRDISAAELVPTTPGAPDAPTVPCVRTGDDFTPPSLPVNLQSQGKPPTPSSQDRVDYTRPGGCPLCGRACSWFALCCDACQREAFRSLVPDWSFADEFAGGGAR